MSRIDDLLARMCPRGVETRRLGEIAQLVRGNGMPRADFTDVGVGCIHYGQIYMHYGAWATKTISCVSPATATRLAKVNPGDVIITNTSENLDDVCKAVAWLGEDQIVTGGHATVVKHDQDPKYLSYWFQTPNFSEQKRRLASGTKVIDVSATSLARVKVPIPPIEVQREIVRVLDTFAALEAELRTQLEAELEARRRQYDHFRSCLLAFDPDAEQSLLSELFEMRSGRFISAAEIDVAQDIDHPFPCYGGNGLRGYVSRPSHNGRRLLVGRQGALSGNVRRANGEFYATEHAVVLAPRAGIDIDWAFHMLTAMNLNQYVSQGAQPGLAVGNLKSLQIAVPVLKEQERIGVILDALDVSARHLAASLPAELRTRREQYEHYRDRLLTFPEASWWTRILVYDDHAAV